MITVEHKQKLSMAYHLTHKANLKDTRYGWLRLTPAYSVHLVSELLGEDSEHEQVLLDPFCGTGTTALVASERGITCDTTDINQFLLWLTRAKTNLYTTTDVQAFRQSAREVATHILRSPNGDEWCPPIHQIEKWWSQEMLSALSRAMGAVKEFSCGISEASGDLLRVAFCRVMIASSNVSFGHQSMSFKQNGQDGQMNLLQPEAPGILADAWAKAIESVAASALSPILSQPRALLADARTLSQSLPLDRYTCVITSPPYPNRMSYIRELRPYMYWLEYLTNGRDAGELDWQAIGGTWGSATSNVGKWKPERDTVIPYDDFYSIIGQIRETSDVLSRYVHKYFFDMVDHSNELFNVVKPGGMIHYIVGNSKFYDVLLPVERIFGSIFEASGFKNVEIRTIRKRSSKKELFEYVVSARKP